MPTDIFMKIRDIQGESRDKEHKDEIEVLSWIWGLSNQVASPSPGGGARAGKTKFQDISFTHLVDKASPNLMLSCASGILFHFIGVAQLRLAHGRVVSQETRL